VKKVTGKQATTAARPHKPPRHKPMPKAERIQMVDLAATQAQAKEASPSIKRKVCQTKATTAKPINVLSPPPIDRVDMLYRQLMEIHAITAAQLVE
jgi:hypothetical protein